MRDPEFNTKAMFLQSLSGMQPLILIAYVALRRAATVDELCELTGKDQKAIRRAVKSLASKGLLFRQAGAHNKETWLPAGDTFWGYLKTSQNALNGQSTGQFALNGQTGLINDVDVDLSDGSPTITSTTTLTGQFALNGQTGLFVENLEAFRDLEMFGPKVRAVSQKEWVNPDYIRAWVRYAESLGWPDNPKGFALAQMLEGAPQPAEPKAQTGEPSNTVKLLPKTRYRPAQEIHYNFDLDQVVADFTGHVSGCRCLDCSMLRSADGDTRVLCPDCRHYRCECPDEDGGGE